MSIGEKIKHFRKNIKLTQEQLALKANMSRSYIADIERDRYSPSVETLRAIASALEIDPAQLLAEGERPYYAFNAKDERDIAKKLEEMMDELDSNTSLSFMGEPMDDEDKELLRLSLENAIRMSKEMAKKKFTPKKYRE